MRLIVPLLHIVGRSFIPSIIIVVALDICHMVTATGWPFWPPSVEDVRAKICYEHYIPAVVADCHSVTLHRNCAIVLNDIQPVHG